MSKPNITLKPGLKILLDAAERNLMQALFSDCQEILIEKEFNEGFTQTRVLLVTPFREKKLAPLVLKIGAVAIIEDEKARHEIYVEEILPLLAANIERFARLDPLAAIAYTYLGGTVLGEGSGSLAKYYQSQSVEDILLVLRYLLITALGQFWYSHRKDKQSFHFFEDSYGATFPANLTVNLDSISHSPLSSDLKYEHYEPSSYSWQWREIAMNVAVQFDGFQVGNINPHRIKLKHPHKPFWIRATYDPNSTNIDHIRPGQTVNIRGLVTSRRQDDLETITSQIFSPSSAMTFDPQAETVRFADTDYPNPLLYWQHYLDQELPHNLTWIHGDLHLLNVIVDGFSRPWLIDFGRTQISHAIFDFIELELDIRHFILGQIELPLTDIIAFEIALLCSDMGVSSVWVPDQSTLKKAFEVIRGIRGFASRYLAPNENLQSEYWPALFVYSMSTLDYHKKLPTRAMVHTFALSSILVAHLQGQLDYQSTSLPIMIIEPSQEYHIYYLKEAAGDTVVQIKQKEKRIQSELQILADALCKWLGLASHKISWDTSQPTRRRQMTRRYFSGQWEDQAHRRRAWLIAYEMNDTYLLRFNISQNGSGYSPKVFAELADQFTSLMERETPEKLGFSQFNTVRTSGPIPELAYAILETNSLYHTPLTCGDLYCTTSFDKPYLLIYSSQEQEIKAGDFFDRIAPQIGWYQHKALRQEAEYEIYLRPDMLTLEQDLATQTAKSQEIFQQLIQGEKSIETWGSLHELIRGNEKTPGLEILLLEFSRQMAVVETILNTIKINVQNYQWITEENTFLTNPNTDEIFRPQNRRLKRLPVQIEADIGYWHPTLNEAKRTLEILQPIANRLPLQNRDPAKLSAAVYKHFESTDEKTGYSKINLTVMVEDIKDSTSYLVQYGDRQWLRLVEQHNKRLATIIQRYKGTLVKHLGDGNLVIFQDATLAVEAALALLVDLQAHNESIDSEDQLQVRIGIHSGLAPQKNSNTLEFAVNFALQICYQADSQEIIISESTYQQAGQSIIGFEEIDATDLKGLDFPKTLYRGNVP